MGEISSANVQMVGEARAKSGEALQQDEIHLTAEQQEVVDVMGAEGQKLETAVFDSRENAADQLKTLTGKELVDAGMKQIKIGVWESFKSRLVWGAGGLVIGLVSGGLYGSVKGKSEEYQTDTMKPIFES